MFDLNSYMSEMIYEYVPNVKRVGTNKLNFRCPLCGDGKKSTSHRGWFYIDTGSYYCWNSGCIANETGMQGLKFISLISGKPINEVRSELVKRAGTFQNAIKKTNEYEKLTIFDDENEERNIERYILDKLDLGEWEKDLPEYIKKYISNRKLNKASYLPKSFKFYYDKKLKRLVIPWSNEYYQERTVFKSQWNEEKYKFPYDVERPIFGIENIDESFKYIFLVEGVFDSVWVKNGVAVGSIILSNHQKEILKEYSSKYTIVYMPDNQFNDKSSYEKTLKMCKEKPYENIFVWPRQFNKFKDINDMIIKSDKFIDVWKSEKFLTQNIVNGITGLMKLN